jgi:hypothetical protein
MASRSDVQESVAGGCPEGSWRRSALAQGRDYKDLTSECQQRFREINVHWHDMRHEYASRLVERGVPLAQVRDLLGHASILTTERYDNQKLEALQAAVERLEQGKTFEPRPAEAGHYVDADKGGIPDKVSRIFQVAAEQFFDIDTVTAARKPATN